MFRCSASAMTCMPSMFNILVFKTKNKHNDPRRSRQQQDMSWLSQNLHPQIGNSPLADNLLASHYQRIPIAIAKWASHHPCGIAISDVLPSNREEIQEYMNNRLWITTIIPLALMFNNFLFFAPSIHYAHIVTRTERKWWCSRHASKCIINCIHSLLSMRYVTILVIENQNSKQHWQCTNRPTIAIE